VRYGSVCSGIEAASVAWHPLGWRPSFFSEIEAFPRAVLAHHYPGVPLHGDFTTIEADQYAAIDVLVGGTPCQSFSLAGLRGGLGDERGNLALEYLRLADRLRPRWLVWENVPGVLSSDGGRDFGSILGGLGELGYGWAYRVLDAQYVRVDGFGRAVPQRRRRVFVVGHLGDWRRAAAVLFERESLSGNPAPRRQAGQGAADVVANSLRSSSSPNGHGHSHGLRGDGADNLVASPTAATLTRGAESSGKGGYAGRRQEDDVNLVARCDTASQTRLDWETETFVAHALRADGFDASKDGTGRGAPLVAVGVAPTLRAGGNETGGDRPYGTDVDTCDSLIAMPPVFQGWRVRRLMPVECERLQGFPDGYTAISYRGKPASDGPRYKALGNSMAVNCMRWIGQRIDMVESLTESVAA